MRLSEKRCIPWVVSLALLCVSVALVVLLLAPRWEAHWASAVADGDTRYALTWAGEMPAAVPQGAASVQPAADWVVRPGLNLTAPDHSVQVSVELVPGETADERWQGALAEGFTAEQTETLSTGAVLRSVTRDDQLFGVLVLGCDERVAVVRAVGVGDARVALGQLLETICPLPAEA